MFNLNSLKDKATDWINSEQGKETIEKAKDWVQSEEGKETLEKAKDAIEDFVEDKTDGKGIFGFGKKE